MGIGGEGSIAQLTEVVDDDVKDMRPGSLRPGRGDEQRQHAHERHFNHFLKISQYNFARSKI